MAIKELAQLAQLAHERDFASQLVAQYQIARDTFAASYYDAVAGDVQTVAQQLVEASVHGNNSLGVSRERFMAVIDAEPDSGAAAFIRNTLLPAIDLDGTKPIILERAEKATFPPDFRGDPVVYMDFSIGEYTLGIGVVNADFNLTVLASIRRVNDVMVETEEALESDFYGLTKQDQLGVASLLFLATRHGLTTEDSDQ